jgi:hypothetical protein
LSRIKAVEKEYWAIRLAANRLLDEASRDSTVLPVELRRRDIATAAARLDGTYIIRLFAEFETGLRLYWQALRDTSPKVQDLIEGVAAAHRISDEKRINVHAVRDYRNSLVHERDEDVDAIPIETARKWLCEFFSFLPLRW